MAECSQGGSSKAPREATALHSSRLTHMQSHQALRLANRVGGGACRTSGWRAAEGVVTSWGDVWERGFGASS